MRRTRRAALAMIAGSSGLLAVDTLGFSSGRAERPVDVEVVSDANAYLGLVDRDSNDDGVETGGVLFEATANGDRYPPASFEVVNQLTEPIALSLAFGDDRLRFVELDADGRIGADHGQRLDADLEPGDGITVAIDLALRSERATVIDLDSITTTLEIDADGAATSIEAERTLTLVADVWVAIDCCAARGYPDGLVVVRNRRLEGGPSLVVEWIDCADGTSTVLHDITSLSPPKLQVSLCSDRSPQASGSTAGLQAAGSEKRPQSKTGTEPTVIAADDITVDVDRGRTGPRSTSRMHSVADSAAAGGGTGAGDGNRSGTESDLDGSSDFAVEIDPDPSAATESDSRRVETVDLSLDSVAGGDEEGSE
ncbi:hypothetical protein [Halopiger thermotolerans]